MVIHDDVHVPGTMLSCQAETGRLQRLCNRPAQHSLVQASHGGGGSMEPACECALHAVLSQAVQCVCSVRPVATHSAAGASHVVNYSV
jgi:hypothetical protein